MTNKQLLLVVLVAAAFVTALIMDTPGPGPGPDPEPGPITEWSQLATDIEDAFCGTLADGLVTTAGDIENGAIAKPRALAESYADDIQDAAIAAAMVLDQAMADQVDQDVTKAPPILRGVAEEWQGE